MSYLIKNNEVIATTTENLKSGAFVDVAHDTCKEQINASRELNLVNAFTVKVSNAKKWESHYTETVAVAINNSTYEFVLV